MSEPRKEQTDNLGTVSLAASLLVELDEADLERVSGAGCFYTNIPRADIRCEFNADQSMDSNTA